MVNPPITPEDVLLISKVSCGDVSPIPTLLFVASTCKVFVSTVKPSDTNAPVIVAPVDVVVSLPAFACLKTTPLEANVAVV